MKVHIHRVEREFAIVRWLDTAVPLETVRTGGGGARCARCAPDRAYWLLRTFDDAAIGPHVMSSVCGNCGGTTRYAFIDLPA